MTFNRVFLPFLVAFIVFVGLGFAAPSPIRDAPTTPQLEIADIDTELKSSAALEASKDTDVAAEDWKPEPEREASAGRSKRQADNANAGDGNNDRPWPNNNRDNDDARRCQELQDNNAAAMQLVSDARRTRGGHQSHIAKLKDKIQEAEDEEDQARRKILMLRDKLRQANRDYKDADEAVREAERDRDKAFREFDNACKRNQGNNNYPQMPYGK